MLDYEHSTFCLESGNIETTFHVIPGLSIVTVKPDGYFTLVYGGQRFTALPLPKEAGIAVGSDPHEGRKYPMEVVFDDVHNIFDIQTNKFVRYYSPSQTSILYESVEQYREILLTEIYRQFKNTLQRSRFFKTLGHRIEMVILRQDEIHKPAYVLLKILSNMIGDPNRHITILLGRDFGKRLFLSRVSSAFTHKQTGDCASYQEALYFAFHHTEEALRKWK
jgi:hypothetical protein